MIRTALMLAPLLLIAACARPGDELPWERHDEHAPQPVESCPADDARDVPTGVQPLIRFEFPGESAPDLDPDSLGDRTVTLISSDAFRVRGYVSLDAARGVVLFAPQDALHPFVRYEIQVTGQVRDVLGNPVEGEYRSTFVTGDESEVDPCTGWPGSGPPEEPTRGEP